MTKVPLYIIAGFLGSGKTSLIRNLIGKLPESRIGLIFNDFGKLNIDATLIPGSDNIYTKELSGGQIFCSCLSGTFVETAASFADLNIDYLFVEASGLAKPSSLLEIITFINKKSSGHFSYRGMICVIDAERYLPLSQSLLTLEEQVVFSDLFIINKTDLADAGVLQQVEDSIRKLQPLGRILKTTHGEVSADILDMEFHEREHGRANEMKYHGWQSPGRPKAFFLEPITPVSMEGLKRFLDEASKTCYRIKGYVLISGDRRVFVSAVGSHIEITPAEHQERIISPGLVFLQKANGTGEKVFPSRWMMLAGGTARIKH